MTGLTIHSVLIYSPYLPPHSEQWAVRDQVLFQTQHVFYQETSPTSYHDREGSQGGHTPFQQWWHYWEGWRRRGQSSQRKCLVSSHGKWGRGKYKQWQATKEEGKDRQEKVSSVNPANKIKATAFCSSIANFPIVETFDH